MVRRDWLRAQSPQSTSSSSNATQPNSRIPHCAAKPGNDAYRGRVLSRSSCRTADRSWSGSVCPRPLYVCFPSLRSVAALIFYRRASLTRTRPACGRLRGILELLLGRPTPDAMRPACWCAPASGGSRVAVFGRVRFDHHHYRALCPRRGPARRIEERRTPAGRLQEQLPARGTKVSGDAAKAARAHAATT